MPITVNCSCGKRFLVPDRFAGRTGPCSGCEAELSVPDEIDDDEASVGDASSAQLLALMAEAEAAEASADGAAGEDEPVLFFEPTRFIAPLPARDPALAEAGAVVIDRRRLAEPEPEPKPEASDVGGAEADASSALVLADLETGEPASPEGDADAPALEPEPSSAPDSESSSDSEPTPESKPESKPGSKPGSDPESASDDPVAARVAMWKSGARGGAKKAHAARPPADAVKAAPLPAATKSASDSERRRSAGPKQVTIGNTIGGYEVKERLGETRSAVFLAKAPDGGEVALKILPRSVIVASPTVGKRFLRAARSLFRLRHENVAAYLDAGEELGNYWVAMERFEGRSLKDLLGDAGGKLGESQVLSIAKGIAAGLGALHGASLIHRNLKPEHVLVGPGGEVKLIGLGLVRGESGDGAGDLTVIGTVVGTPEYLSPEQARVDPDLDGRADLYSLGAMIFEMLTGAVPYPREPGPFVRTMMRIVSDPIPDVAQRGVEVSAPTAAVVTRLLAKSPGERYQTAGELVKALDELQRSRPAAPGAEAGAATPRRRASDASQTTDADAQAALLRTVLIAVAALGVVVVVLVIVLVVVLLTLVRS